jgi:hypothetical protein
MVLYKHRLFVFGGFYDTLREVRYFEDLHVLDLDEMKWTEVKQKPGGIAPSPRSAFQVRRGLSLWTGVDWACFCTYYTWPVK